MSYFPGDSVADQISQFLVGWTDLTIGEIARGLASAVGLGSHVVRTIETVRTGYLDVEVQWNYKPDGKPVALWLELGTKPHDIEGDPLSWIDKRTGDRRFAMRVHHPGFAGYGILERARELGTPLLSQKIQQYFGGDHVIRG